MNQMYFRPGAYDKLEDAKLECQKSNVTCPCGGITQVRRINYIQPCFER